jgi:endonuclease/exonuclease/phosphatase family metal-dependent hydrolase
MTYNILAPDYANPAWFPGTNRGQLRWSLREPKLRQLIAKQDADLLCLQEVQFGMCRQSLQAFVRDLGYDSAYQVKCTESGEPLYDLSTLGVLVCWKRDKFCRVGEPATIAMAGGVARLCGGDTFYSSGNFQVALAVLLRPLDQPKFGFGGGGAVAAVATVGGEGAGGGAGGGRGGRGAGSGSGAGTISSSDGEGGGGGCGGGDSSGRGSGSSGSGVGGGSGVVDAGDAYVLLISTHMMAPRSDDDHRRKYEQMLQTFSLLHSVAALKREARAAPVGAFTRLVAGGQAEQERRSGVEGMTAAGEEEAKEGAEEAKVVDEKVRAASAGGGHRVMTVLCGDFNAPPSSASYAVLTKGVAGARNLIKRQRELFLDSLSPQSRTRAEALGLSAEQQLRGLPRFDSAFALVHGEEPRHTNYTAAFRECIDYIFVEGCGCPDNNDDGDGGDGGDDDPSGNGDDDDTRLHHQWLQPVSAERYPHFDLDRLFSGTSQRSLPSDNFPSDHLPVVVEFAEARAVTTTTTTGTMTTTTRRTPTAPRAASPALQQKQRRKNTSDGRARPPSRGR